MLTKKWETKDRYGRLVSRQRDASKWKESMWYKWAMVKMEKDEHAMQKKRQPNIERLEHESEVLGGGGGCEGKSVNAG
jgi:hypothetical protein